MVGLSIALWIAYALGPRVCLLIASIPVWFALYWRVLRRDSGRGKAAVLVIGDYGRSPRMQYHTASLAALCERVFVVADAGSEPCAEVLAGKNIDLSMLMSPIVMPAWLPWAVRAVLKALLQTLRLPYVLLFKMPKCNVVLLQNPPALPILPVAVLACQLRGMSLVLDWHNLGYTIIEMDNRPAAFVAFYKFVERYFGRFAAFNLTVCKSMQTFLVETWGTVAAGPDSSVVMYDCAPAFFRRGGPATFRTLAEERGLADIVETEVCASFYEGGKEDNGGAAAWRRERPALLVSGTSWTVDEDVGMFIDSLVELDGLLTDGSRTDLPAKVVVVITGKGGVQKDEAEARIKELRLARVRIYTGFLRSLQDYATLLGCADLGVSLHNSSSGMDLPMKVVDMLGCALPVAALHFPTLDELVTRENGVTFADQASLTACLVDMLSGWSVDPQNERAASPMLEERRAGMIARPRPRWADEWGAKV